MGSTLNITLAFFDPDANDVHSFTSLPSTYSNCFFVHPNTGKIQLAKEIDYETMPHTITFGKLKNFYPIDKLLFVQTSLVIFFFIIILFFSNLLPNESFFLTYEYA